MSLVNKMLKDLEARQGDARTGRPIFQDLHSAHRDRRRGPGRLMFLIALLLAGGGYLAWQYWGAALVAPNQTAALTVAPAAPPAPEPATPAPTAPEATATATSPATSGKPHAGSDSNPEKDAPDVVKAGPLLRSTRESAPTVANSSRITKTDRPYTPEELVANAYREAQLARTQGNPAEAERRLRTLLAAQPRHTQARELLAAIQVESGRWPEAQETLEQGVTQVPSHVAFRFQLARLHLEHGSEPKAIAVLERARADGIQDVELPAFLAALYQRGGRHEDAIKNYKEALAVRPAEGKWWLGLGISLEARQDSAAARDAYRRALDTGRLPDNLTRYAEDRLKALAAR
jgi:MSHA biogenesis protein MshN